MLHPHSSFSLLFSHYCFLQFTLSTLLSLQFPVPLTITITLFLVFLRATMWRQRRSSWPRCLFRILSGD
ncbi:hypothetical protein E2C01_096630 [Portunus trituberculatus]|uniref:Uncharacterized protein n=1 Tax=Portunus trituberculatus TaxID=210409 RepID=A0A5B7K3K2_PORTR|nr:hypothetical protein [Portunus trituberculatus]